MFVENNLSAEGKYEETLANITTIILISLIIIRKVNNMIEDLINIFVILVVTGVILKSLDTLIGSNTSSNNNNTSSNNNNTSSNNNNTLGGNYNALGGNYSHSFDNTEILKDKYRQLERNEKAMDYIRQVENNMASTQREIDKTDRILNSYPKL